MLRWESVFSQLFADYIKVTAVSDKWPAELAALECQTQDFTGEVKRARLYFETTLAEGGHSKARVGATVITLETSVPVGDKVEGLEGVVKPVVAAEWMSAIGRRVMDHDALQAFISALPIEQRREWSLLKWPWISDSGEENDEDQRTRNYSHTLLYKFRF